MLERNEVYFYNYTLERKVVAVMNDNIDWSNEILFQVAMKGYKCVLKCDLSLLWWLFQIFMDFDEIRQEIEAETERLSGNNKVC